MWFIDQVLLRTIPEVLENRQIFHFRGEQISAGVNNGCEGAKSVGCH